VPATDNVASGMQATLFFSSVISFCGDLKGNTIQKTHQNKIIILKYLPANPTKPISIQQICNA
jgi:hypothetical protein